MRTGRVELGDDPDAAAGSEVNDPGDVGGGVDHLLAVGALERELGLGGEQHGEGLGVGDVPVEDVELVDGHGADRAQDVLHRVEAPGGVEQQPTVGEDRRVGDVDSHGDGGGIPPH